MTIQNLYPTTDPTLLLDFASVKALDPRITFTRASSARYYDGYSTAKAEENLLVRSQEFETTWSRVFSNVTANSTTAPDGTTTADTLTESSSGTNQSNISQAVAVTINNAYTLSVFVKQGTETFFQMLFGQAGFGVNAFANFNVTTGAGAVGTVGSSASASIVDVGNGWYRCTMTATSTASSSSVPCQMNIVESTSALRAPEITLNSGTIFLWGAQLEQRSTVTAYTPTTAQPITNYVPVLLSAANNVARFNYNPVTGAPLGLLIEEQRTNLLLRSEEFDSGSWLAVRASISSNTIISPDGSITADKLVENTATDNHFTRQAASTTLLDNTVYTFSVYAKAAERTTLCLVVRTKTNAFPTSYFNLINGTVGGTSAEMTTTIQNVGNGWYRCSVSQNIQSGATNPEFFILTSTGTGIQSYTGNGYSGIYIWGAQVEAGSFSTSYIPTVAAQVTRSNDTAVMTGANFSSWYRADEGTLFSESVIENGVQINAGTFGISRGNPGTSFNDNSITVRHSGGTFGVSRSTVADANGSAVVDISVSTSAAVRKVSLSYKTDDFAASTNGSAVVTDTVGVIPGTTAVQALIGCNTFNTNRINGHIRKIAYYPKRLANAELQALTQN
jgi:hypothetical protein